MIINIKGHSFIDTSSIYLIPTIQILRDLIVSKHNRGWYRYIRACEVNIMFLVFEIGIVINYKRRLKK